MTTSALLNEGSGGERSAAVATSADPTTRAIEVAATSARAARCGFYFDPDKLRAQYLASEVALGASPEALQQIARAYDYSRAAVAQSAGKEPGYCTEEKTRATKEDLNRHLAGDFTPRVHKRETEPGLLAAFQDLGASESSSSFNPDTYYDITGKPGPAR